MAPDEHLLQRHLGALERDQTLDPSDRVLVGEPSRQDGQGQPDDVGVALGQAGDELTGQRVVRLALDREVRDGREHRAHALAHDPPPDRVDAGPSRLERLPGTRSPQPAHLAHRPATHGPDAGDGRHRRQGGRRGGGAPEPSRSVGGATGHPVTTR